MFGIPAGPSGRRPSRAFATLALLYVAQALPSYLFGAALPPILRESGVSRSTIGLMSLLLLPLVLKFLWAPVVDRTRLFRSGHRRGWILVTQLGVIGMVASLSLVGPTDVVAIFCIGVTLALLVSTQDIATDGYAVLVLRPEQRGTGNAIQAGAVAVGVMLGGTLSLLLHDRFGWGVMVLTMVVLSLLPLFALVLMQEEETTTVRPGPSLPKASIRAFLDRPEAVTVLGIAFIYRASEGLVKGMEGAYLVDADLSLSSIGWLKGTSAATAGLVGAALAALLLRRIGTARTLILLGLLRTFCFLIFSLHAVESISWVEGSYPIVAAVAFQTFLRYMEIVALYSLFMTVASRDQPGTDFTILACAQLFVYQIGVVLSGFIADHFDYAVLFIVATLISAVSIHWVRTRISVSLPGLHGPDRFPVRQE